MPLRLYTLPYWSNPPFLIFDIGALWLSLLQTERDFVKTAFYITIYTVNGFYSHQGISDLSNELVRSVYRTFGNVEVACCTA